MALITNLKSKIFNSEIKKDKFSLDALRKIPELPETLGEDIVPYEIIGDIVIANVQKGLYRVGEPTLSEEQQKTYDLVKNGLYEILDLETTENAQEYIEKSTRTIISELDLRLPKEFLRKILYNVYRDIIGFGKIEPILRDSLITELSYDKSLAINHRIYGELKSEIVLNNEELSTILRKLATKCNKELKTVASNMKCESKGWTITIDHNPAAMSNSKFTIKKSHKTYPSPIALMKERKVSPEILAFLWIALEEKKEITITKDTNILNALSYFFPSHVKVLTNIEDYYPNIYTETYIGNSFGKEDYALIDNYKDQFIETTLICSTDSEEEKNIVVSTKDGIITSLKENGTELFTLQDNKFLFNISNSQFFESKGNRAILEEEFNIRTKLLLLLAKNSTNDKDFRKIINIYYQNPTAVLKKAGLA